MAAILRYCRLHCNIAGTMLQCCRAIFVLQRSCNIAAILRTRCHCNVPVATILQYFGNIARTSTRNIPVATILQYFGNIARTSTGNVPVATFLQYFCKYFWKLSVTNFRNVCLFKTLNLFQRHGYLGNKQLRYDIQECCNADISWGLILSNFTLTFDQS